jgi:hypothetical protein
MITTPQKGKPRFQIYDLKIGESGGNYER